MIAQCDAGEITHHAFPVVDQPEDPRGRRLRAIITLEDLKLAIAELQGESHFHEDSTPEVRTKSPHDAAPNHKRKRRGGAGAAADAAVDTMDLQGKVDLLEYADRSPITTYPHAKVARAFEVFRKLGMRHMCVVDQQGTLVGMLTRKDLMTFRINENIQVRQHAAPEGQRQVVPAVIHIYTRGCRVWGGGQAR